jgi:hypothetical protein
MRRTSSNAELFPVFGESRLFPGEHALYYRKRDAVLPSELHAVIVGIGGMND